MTLPPLLAPPEAQPDGDPDAELAPDTMDTPRTESMARPFRLGLVGLATAVGLFARLLAANGFGELDSRTILLAVAAASAFTGIGLLLMAAERDRFGFPVMAISGITSLAWGALNWISPPFADEATVWNQTDQAVLAVVGVGNGLLLAGIVALAFVRRHPTLSVAATLLAGVCALASSSAVLRQEWPAIVCLGIAFALILLAWDRSPRYEEAFARPQDPPRFSRAALSFLSVALCGTAVQLWLSRMDTPRSIPAIVLCALLVAAAFASLVRVRREIEQRETTLSEWTSWMREIRTNDFRAEMVNFESAAASDPSPFDEPDAHAAPAEGDGEAPRPLSFPNLVVSGETADEAAPVALGLTVDIEPDIDGPPNEHKPPDTSLADLVLDVEPRTPSEPAEAPTATSTDEVPDIVVPTTSSELPRITADLPSTDSSTPEPAPTSAEVVDLTPDAAPETTPPVDSTEPAPTSREPTGAFSALLAADEPTDPAPVAVPDDVGNLGDFARWLTSPDAGSRPDSLVVAIEAMTLEEYDSLPPADAGMATAEIGSYLAEIMPTADLVGLIDGPYFLVAHTSASDGELLELNKNVRKALKATNGVLAFIRPGPTPTLETLVNEAVQALLQARRADQRSAGS